MNHLSITTAVAKEEFSDLVNRVSHQNEHIVLTRRGKEIAALIPIQDLELLESVKNKHDLAEAVESLREARNKGTVSFEDFKSRLLQTAAQI